jgi:excisionase family DNA binding protein
VLPRGCWRLRNIFGRKRGDALQIGMSPKHLSQIHSTDGSAVGLALLPEELPLTVREAAVYLGVSTQTVYLWVERKQIPHLRVMGRNIRFLKSDLEPFRGQFKQEVENWQDQ